MPDNTLELLIKLGVIGKDDAKAVKDLLGDTAESATRLNDTVPASLAGWDKYRDRLHETGVEGLDLREKLHLLHLTGRSLGGGFEELARMGGLLFNPLTGGAVAAIAGFNALFEAIARNQEALKKMGEEAGKVNDIVKEIIAARPTSTEEWMKLTEQMAKLHAETDHSLNGIKSINDALHAYDENKVKNAFDFEKPGLERKVITDDISNARVDLTHLQKTTGNLAEAQEWANTSAATAADLKKQIEELPKAIALAQANAARDHDRLRTASVFEQTAIWNDKMQQEDMAKTLQADLDRAKSNFPGAADAAAKAEAQVKAIEANNAEMVRLRQELITLSNRLTAFDDAQRGKQQHDRVESVINFGSATHQSLGEIGKALGLSEQQIVTMARSILAGQASHQAVMEELMREFQAATARAAALRNNQISG